MKIVYGIPNTMMTMGMAMLGDLPTPFFGFVEKDKIFDDPSFSETMTASDLINKIHDLNGTIIYLENQDVAGYMMQNLSVLLSGAVDGPWGEHEPVEARLQ